MLTKIGKYFLKRKNSLLILLILIVPTIFIMIFSYFEYAKYIRLEHKLHELQKIASNTYLKRKFRKNFLEKHFDSDQNFLSKIKNFSFLQNEIADLQKISNQSLFDADKVLSQRLKSISSNNNLKFIQDQSKTNKQVKETKYCSQSSVEATLQDTFSFLAELENQKAPQFIIYDLKLHRKENNFELDIAFLQREFFRKP